MKTIQKLAINGEIYPVGGGGGGSALEVYDGEERVIGTYFGKPLYRRAIKTTAPESASSYSQGLGVSIENLETLVFLLAVVTTTENWKIPLYTRDGSGEGYVSINPSGELMMYTTNRYYFSCPLDITVEYTKTTDPEIYPVVGGINGFVWENYSEEEQRIGTWFGKPLYRRTFIGLTTSEDDSGKDILNLSELFVDTVVSLKGGLIESNGTIPLNCYTLAWYVSTFVRTINGVKTVRIFATGDKHNSEATITLEYTKTTDTSRAAADAPAGTFSYDTGPGDIPAVAATAPAIIKI